MALDEALMMQLPSSGLPVLRFYRWRSPCLTVGYFQSVPRDIDRERCRESGIPVVRRPTGGRAIFHDQELTYSLAALESDPLFEGGILRSYARVSRGLVAGLRSLGVPAEAIPPRRRPLPDKSPACFDAIAGYEVAVEGRKLVGSAQVRRGGVALQQGSILLRVEPEKLFRLLRYADEGSRRRLEASFSRWVASLDQVMDGLPSVRLLLAAFQRGFRQALGVELVRSQPSPEERASARRLVREKYGQPHWNLMR